MNGAWIRGKADVALARKLDRLPNKVFRRVVKSAAGKAMTPVARETRRRAPVLTGALRKMIGKRTMVKKDGESFLVFVGVKWGTVQYTQEITNKRKGTTRRVVKKKIPALYAKKTEDRTHFSSEAAAASLPAAEEQFRRLMAEGIAKEAVKPA